MAALLNPKMYEGLPTFNAYVRLLGALRGLGKVELPTDGMAVFLDVGGKKIYPEEVVLTGSHFPEIINQLNCILRNNKGHRIFSVREPTEADGKISLSFSVTAL